MKEKQLVYDALMIDVEERTFTILDGSVGTYDLEDLEKCAIACEDAKWRGKSEPFTHTVLTGIGVLSTPLFEPSFYVGLKVTMKNKDVLAIYISKVKTVMNSDIYFKDMKVAKKLKRILERK